MKRESEKEGKELNKEFMQFVVGFESHELLHNAVWYVLFDVQRQAYYE